MNTEDKELTQPRAGLYLCTRTSDWGEKPCDEAFQIKAIKVDARDCDDPKKIPANFGTDGDWYTKGLNHRIEDGIIMRDLGAETKWAVEINDIQKFVDRYGPCVVSRSVNGFCTIEIYDGHRE